MPDDLFGDGDPSTGDPDAWQRLIAALGPAWLLVTIRSRMGANLARRYAPEDVLQEALLHAWRDRARCTWQGVRAFRSWLLQIIDNRRRDLAEHERAQEARRRGNLGLSPRRRFAAEAEALGRLRHPHVVASRLLQWPNSSCKPRDAAQPAPAAPGSFGTQACR